MLTPPQTPEFEGVSSISAPLPPSENQRFFIVSNRLPVTLHRKDDGHYHFKESSGGLATGMGGVKRDAETTWYGWPGVEIPADRKGSVRSELKEKYGAVPVDLPNDVAERYYNGFSNGSLWPVLHYQSGAMKFRQEDWIAYKHVNQCFANIIAEHANNGDLVWVHDYHLMLLPRMLINAAEKQKKNIVVGFFLHTPFPTGDMFKIHPVWQQLMDGMLGSALIGFHTQTYVDNFRRACSDYLGYTQFPRGVGKDGSFVNLGIYPIGIDVPKFVQHMEQPDVKDGIHALRQKYNVEKLVIGVDRLDYIKGIPQKLVALQKFFEQHPEWIGRVSMIQVAVPSRENVAEYKQLADELHQQVDKLNAKYGREGYQPIHFLHHSVPFEDLMIMYAASDVCLVSSIRDGMNLVSYEYVASQRERHGVLALSEFAGASEQLHGSVLFNPWDLDATAEALYTSIVMESYERTLRHKRSEEYVLRNSSSAWGKSFMGDLKSSSKLPSAEFAHMRYGGNALEKPETEARKFPDCAPFWRRQDTMLRRETS